MRPITRRRLLAASTTGALALVAASPAGMVADWLWPAALDVRLSRLFRHAASVQRIGAAYLRAYPQEADRRTLNQELATLDGGSGPFRPAGDQLRRRLVSASRADFAAGRVVTVQGWVFSLTEARAYAMVAAREAAITGVRGSSPRH